MELHNIKNLELARIRTWNLLIRSQTRYPLRHKPDCGRGEEIVSRNYESLFGSGGTHVIFELVSFVYRSIAFELMKYTSWSEYRPTC